MTRREAIAILASLAVAPVSACQPRTPSIAFDRDGCAFCRMTISDRRFGAVARGSGGRLERFDSIECLVRWLAGGAGEAPAIWLVDATAPGTLIPLADAVIRRTMTSPMGRRGAGFAASQRNASRAGLAGEVVTWTDVRREIDG